MMLRLVQRLLRLFGYRAIKMTDSATYMPAKGARIVSITVQSGGSGGGGKNHK